ncbi:MAG: hypothetical protein ACRDMX_02520 [Solirubrobacteraceae bacterium]
MISDSLDAISVQLQFGDNDRWEGDPAGAQLGEWDWSAIGVAELIEEPQLLVVGDLHGLDLPTDCRRALASVTCVSARSATCWSCCRRRDEPGLAAWLLASCSSSARWR